MNINSQLAWKGHIEVLTVDGPFSHQCDPTASADQVGPEAIVECLFNLYQAGVEDADPQYRNPPLADAVKISITLTLEILG